MDGTRGPVSSIVDEEPEWVSTLPEGLTELAPGPVLAGLLESVDPAGVDAEELTDLIEARARQVAHLRALMLPEILRAARQVIAEQPSDVWASLKRRYAADLIAITLHCSQRWAQRQIDLAEGLEELPIVYQALLAGRIDEARAEALVDGLAHVEDRALAAQIVARLLAKASRWSLAELRERLRYHVDRKDPRAARRRYTRRVANRNVLLMDSVEGTAHVTGCDLPAEKASAAYDRVDRLARAARSCGDPRTLNQLRADAFLDLLTGQPFQLTPDTDPLRAEADADYPDQLPPEPVDPPHPDPEAEEPVGAYDYESASIPDTDRTWFAAHYAPEPPAPNSPSETGNPGTQSGAGGGDASRFETGNPPPGRFAALGVLPADRCSCGGLLPATRPGRCDVAVRLSTLAGLDDHPALIPGLGPVPADVARQVAFDAAANPVWRYSVFDEDGVLLHHGTTDRPATAGTDSRSETGNSAGPICTCPRVQPGERRGIVDLHLTKATLAGLAANPDLPPGFRAVLADIAEQLAADERANPPGTWSTVDSDGVPLSYGHTERHFNAEEAAFIRARDKTCRTPHCRRKASGCDLDHTIPYSRGGPSHRGNGDALCRRHHRMRDQPGFHRTRRGNTVIWTLPNGRTYTVGPDKDISLTRDDD